MYMYIHAVSSTIYMCAYMYIIIYMYIHTYCLHDRASLFNIQQDSGRGVLPNGGCGHQQSQGNVQHSIPAIEAAVLRFVKVLISMKRLACVCAVE